jgi:hypothetical protein
MQKHFQMLKLVLLDKIKRSTKEWAEAPAKLVGWFDRVWSHGFAWGIDTTYHPTQKL